MEHTQSSIKMKGTAIVILFLFYVTSCYVCNGAEKRAPEHVYEYGVDSGSDEIYNYNGVTPHYTPIIRHKIHVPKGFMVTYVKVTVRSWLTPEVAYSPETKYVSIAFDTTQRRRSHYTIQTTNCTATG